jgi:threonine/homoserine/homoserine lactone efflux protein
MLTLLHSAVVLTIVLAYLLLALCGPFVLAWFVWRCMRDLHRIADAQESTARYAKYKYEFETDVMTKEAERHGTGISNSMFAR